MLESKQTENLVSLGSTCCVAYNIKDKSYPFDWCDIDIKTLCKVLKNDFSDFNILIKGKLSEHHKDFKTNKSTHILTNKYKVKFAHQLDIDTFSIKLVKRIERFRDLKNPLFIRYEKKPYKKNYDKSLNELNDLLKKKFDSYQLILILHDSYPKYKNAYYFNEFSPDWKRTDLDYIWKKIKKL